MSKINNLNYQYLVQRARTITKDLLSYDTLLQTTLNSLYAAEAVVESESRNADILDKRVAILGGQLDEVNQMLDMIDNEVDKVMDEDDLADIPDTFVGVRWEDDDEV